MCLRRIWCIPKTPEELHSDLVYAKVVRIHYIVFEHLFLFIKEFFSWLRPFEIYLLDDKCNIGPTSFEVGTERKCHEKKDHGTCINKDDTDDAEGFQCLCKPGFHGKDGKDCTPRGIDFGNKHMNYCIENGSFPSW